MVFRGLGEGLGAFRGERRADVHRDDEAPLLPKFDYQDGAFVAAFSARGATGEGIVEAAKEDYAALLREHAGQLGLAGRREKAGA
jgi:hypothetical protein